MVLRKERFLSSVTIALACSLICIKCAVKSMQYMHWSNPSDGTNGLMRDFLVVTLKDSCDFFSEREKPLA